MIPCFFTPWGEIPTFPLCVIMGILTMLLLVHILLRTAESRSKEEAYIYPKIVISLGVACFSAGIFDSFFKFLEYGMWRFGGIMFYGGLIGSMVAMFFMLKFSAKEGCSQYKTGEWLDILTPPLIGFHFWGRMGCFLGGCCYGKETDSVFGVVFPDNIANSIIHNGVKRYPTQLFEAGILVILFLIVLFVKHRVRIYLLLYGVSRFLLEYLRGDDRGHFLRFLSPSQMISVVLIVAVIVYTAIDWKRKKSVRGLRNHSLSPPPKM